MLLRSLPVILGVALLVYSLIDCLQTDRSLVRALPKELWLVLILVLPIVGPLAWLVAGRPAQRRPPTGARRPQAVGDPQREPPVSDLQQIDEQLRRDLERVDREHEEALRRWRESQRRRGTPPKPTPPTPPERGPQEPPAG
jgi:hypothetical protein